MIADRPRVVRALLEAEARMHRAGWDNIPAALLVLDASGGPADGPLQAAAVPIPLHDAEPGRLLLQFAVNLAFDPQPMADRVLRRFASESFAGFAFGHEGWIWRKPEEPQPGVRLADQVGAEEMRGMYCIDTCDTVWTVQRIRGEQPAVESFSPGGEGGQPGGRVVDALRLLTAAVCSKLPATEHRMPALPVVDDGPISVEDVLRRMYGKLPTDGFPDSIRARVGLPPRQATNS